MFRCLKQFIRKLLQPAMPGELYVLATQEPNMARFKLQVMLPATLPEDQVTKREFSYTVNGGDPTVLTPELTQASVEFTAPENATLSMSLRDSDAAGNWSEKRTRDLTVTDTIPPHQPGEFQVNVVEQLPDETPTPTPPA